MKIYLCTTAPSSEYKSWSNIPYLLHKNLENYGFHVVNYVMREIGIFKYLFNLPIRLLRKLCNIKTEYFYVRTPIHFFTACIYSKYISLISNPDDIMLVQGFSYPLRNKKNKMILVGDWPSSYLFEKFLKRMPNKCESKSIAREDRVIESADLVITLFPDVYDYMSKRYSNRNIRYFGNVVNVDDEIKIPKDIITIKSKSNRLLFIGQPFYLQGALELISAVNNLVKNGFNLEVDIVGIPENLINHQYDWLFIHGYLDKALPDQKNKYYSLLTNAKLFVNTTTGWNGFQATLEAMYFYNPIIVRKNTNMLQTFPRINDFSYNIDGESDSLESAILKSIDSQDIYLSKCLAAHNSAEGHSWKNFIKNLERYLQ